MMYGYGYYDYYPFHIFGFIFMAIFWIFLIFLLVRLLRGHAHGRRGRWYRDDNDALDILRERYAKGEITKEQYHEMRKELE